MDRLRIVVGGYIGLYPSGGATWDYIQYVIGLKDLGHEVYYIEDTGQFPIFQKNKNSWDDATDCVDYLKITMDDFQLENSWAYRDAASGKCFGMSLEKVLRICSTADVFINLSCSTVLRDEYRKIPRRILIDTDPMFTQIQYAKELAEEEESKLWTTRQMIEGHNYLFTFGENISSTYCRIPTFGIKWIPTRQPICLSLWENFNGNNGKFTSIMNWSGRKRISYDNEEWGQKDIEFMKFKNLPSLLSENNFEVVINNPLNPESSYNREDLERLNWKIICPESVSSDIHQYRSYIQNSLGEFSVAKETYVKSRSGWFSCRSACYLASGKPVVTEETGWSEYIPSGIGLFAFSNYDEAIEAIRKITSGYSLHSQAAKQIASDYFDSNLVLAKLLDEIN